MINVLKHFQISLPHVRHTFFLGKLLVLIFSVLVAEGGNQPDIQRLSTSQAKGIDLF